MAAKQSHLTHGTMVAFILGTRSAAAPIAAVYPVGKAHPTSTVDRTNRRVGFAHHDNSIILRSIPGLEYQLLPRRFPKQNPDAVDSFSIDAHIRIPHP